MLLLCYISLFLALNLTLSRLRTHLGLHHRHDDPKILKKVGNLFLCGKERKKLLTQSNQVFACNIHRCQNSPECCNNTLSYLFLQRKFNQIRKCSKDLQFAAKVFLLNYLQISYHGIINQSSSFSSLIQFHKLLLFRRKSFNKFKKPVKC